jgi:hypothetical protein
MTTSSARVLWLALALTPLGCPLLIDDEFLLVEPPAESAAGANGDAPASAGAPTAPVCPAPCDSCTGSTCILGCSGEAACKDRMLACPAGHACQLTCAGKAACEKLRLLCPPASACSVRCEGEQDACKDMTVTCGTSRCEAECPMQGAGPKLICGKSVACEPCL